jgi:hypothetical protein
MAFRAGKNGYDLWPECRDRGVAIIQYDALNDIDLSQQGADELAENWGMLQGTQRTSLRRFVSEMTPGDTIYVKCGPRIVCKGEIKSDYIFNSKNPIIHDGVPWQHQRKVSWIRGLPEVENPTKQNIVTVKPLTPADVRAIERQYSGRANQDSRYATDSDIEGIRYEIITMTASRSRRLRDKAFRRAGGICAVCEQDFKKLLSGRGIRVLQVHHTRMLSKTESETQTKLEDLVVVCANCHLLLHLDIKRPLTVRQLKRLLATGN